MDFPRLSSVCLKSHNNLARYDTYALTQTGMLSIMRALERDRMETHSGISAVW